MNEYNAPTMPGSVVLSASTVRALNAARDALWHSIACTDESCRVCSDRRRRVAERNLREHAELFSFYCAMERACRALPETAGLADEWARMASSEEWYLMDAERSLA